MATTAYLVTIAANGQGQTLQGGANAVVVAANTTTEAKQLAAVALGLDAMDAVWLGSTEVTVTAIAAATDWADPVIWNFRVVVSAPIADGGLDVYDVTVSADSTNDTPDEIGALLVTALEAAGGALLTPSYSANVLTISAIADDIGDHIVNVYAWPSVVGGDEGPKNVGAFFGTVTDEGIAGAALTVAFVADAGTVGKVYGSFRQVALSL